MRIFLVEDNEELRYEMCHYLTKHRHDVTACGSLVQAREALVQVGASSTPEAIVCDVNLPDGNGVDFCIEVAPRLPSGHWILLSGGHDPERVKARMGNLSGQVRWVLLDKPVSMRSLNETLGNLKLLD